MISFFIFTPVISSIVFAHWNFSFCTFSFLPLHLNKHFLIGELISNFPLGKEVLQIKYVLEFQDMKAFQLILP